jgi:hypothetical protein
MIPTKARKIVRTTEVTEPSDLKQALRKLISEAPIMKPVMNFPMDYAPLYEAVRLWTARLAVLAGCPSEHDLVVIAESE